MTSIPINIAEHVGRTPMVRLARLAEGAQVFAKLEMSNPGGSVKDRIGVAMIEAAEAEGIIEPGRTTIVEATSGNTGIALASARARPREGDAWLPDHFATPATPDVHRRTTGPELWDALDGKIDYLVAGVGTGGTITGAGSFLKERNPKLQVIAVEPASSPVLSGGRPGPP